MKLNHIPSARKLNAVLNAKKQCMNPACKAMPRYVRGLCHGCYSAALRYVKRNFTTWAELEEHGKSMPAVGKIRRTQSSWLVDFKDTGGRNDD